LCSSYLRSRRHCLNRGFGGIRVHTRYFGWQLSFGNRNACLTTDAGIVILEIHNFVPISSCSGFTPNLLDAVFLHESFDCCSYLSSQLLAINGNGELFSWNDLKGKLLELGILLAFGFEGHKIITHDRTEFSVGHYPDINPVVASFQAYTDWLTFQNKVFKSLPESTKPYVLVGLEDSLQDKFQSSKELIGLCHAYKVTIHQLGIDMVAISGAKAHSYRVHYNYGRMNSVAQKTNKALALVHFGAHNTSKSTKVKVGTKDYSIALMGEYFPSEKEAIVNKFGSDPAIIEHVCDAFWYADIAKRAAGLAAARSLGHTVKDRIFFPPPVDKKTRAKDPITKKPIFKKHHTGLMQRSDFLFVNPKNENSPFHGYEFPKV